MNDYTKIQSVIDLSSGVDNLDHLGYQFEKDLDCKFQEFNCISFQEEERSMQIIS